MSITNRSKKPRAVYIEPEGADFWMLPEQTFELRVEANSAEDRFELLDDGESLQVFFGRCYISVYCDGQELVCGHQRPQAL